MDVVRLSDGLIFTFVILVFCPNPVNMSEVTNLVTRYMEIEEILAEVHNTPDSESYWVEDLLAEKEEIKEKLFERGYEL